MNYCKDKAAAAEMLDGGVAGLWMSEQQLSSWLMWEVVCSLLIPAEPSRGGSHLTQHGLWLSAGTGRALAGPPSSSKRKKKTGSEEILWLKLCSEEETHVSFTPLFSFSTESQSVNQPDSCSRRFILWHAKAFLCKYKRSTSFICILLCRAFVCQASVEAITRLW